MTTTTETIRDDFENTITLQGRLAAYPEYRTYESGTTTARFLITTHGEGAAGGANRVDVIPITLWDTDPDGPLSALNPGDWIHVEGRLERRMFDTDDKRRSALIVAASSITPA